MYGFCDDGYVLKEAQLAYKQSIAPQAAGLEFCVVLKFIHLYAEPLR